MTEQHDTEDMTASDTVEYAKRKGLVIRVEERDGTSEYVYPRGLNGQPVLPGEWVALDSEFMVGTVVAESTVKRRLRRHDGVQLVDESESLFATGGGESDAE